MSSIEPAVEIYGCGKALDKLVCRFGKSPAQEPFRFLGEALLSGVLLSVISVSTFDCGLAASTIVVGCSLGFTLQRSIATLAICLPALLWKSLSA